MAQTSKFSALVHNHEMLSLTSDKSREKQGPSLEAPDLRAQMLATVYAFVLECHARKVGVDSLDTPEGQGVEHHAQTGVSPYS